VPAPTSISPSLCATCRCLSSSAARPPESLTGRAAIHRRPQSLLAQLGRALYLERSRLRAGHGRSGGRSRSMSITWIWKPWRASGGGCIIRAALLEDIGRLTAASRLGESAAGPEVSEKVMANRKICAAWWAPPSSLGYRSLFHDHAGYFDGYRSAWLRPT